MLAVFALVFTSCSSDDNVNNAEMAHIQLNLRDAAVATGANAENYAKVEIELKDVYVYVGNFEKKI